MRLARSTEVKQPGGDLLAKFFWLHHGSQFRVSDSEFGIQFSEVTRNSKLGTANGHGQSTFTPTICRMRSSSSSLKKRISIAPLPCR